MMKPNGKRIENNQLVTVQNDNEGIGKIVQLVAVQNGDEGIEIKRQRTRIKT